MLRNLTGAVLALSLALAVPAQADIANAPPGGAYKKVSSLVKLPNFIPGIGVLYVNPKTLPAGPFLAYDRRGRLVSTVYMIPLKGMNKKKKWTGLKTAGAPARHVDIYYNAGHPGVAEPHYHIVIWHISRRRAMALK